jgi:hypothetical protein
MVSLGEVVPDGVGDAVVVTVVKDGGLHALGFVAAAVLAGGQWQSRLESEV